MGLRSRAPRRVRRRLRVVAVRRRPDGILVVADSGEIAFANEQAGTLFGCDTSS